MAIKSPSSSQRPGLGSALDCSFQRRNRTSSSRRDPRVTAHDDHSLDAARELRQQALGQLRQLGRGRPLADANLFSRSGRPSADGRTPDRKLGTFRTRPARHHHPDRIRSPPRPLWARARSRTATDPRTGGRARQFKPKASRKHHRRHHALECLGVGLQRLRPALRDAVGVDVLGPAFEGVEHGFRDRAAL